jgi:uncharacterized membrane protein YczE
VPSAQPDPIVAAPGAPASATPAVATVSRWDPRIFLPRLPGLIAGLLMIGVGAALMARSGLGLGSWEILHQGIAAQLGTQMGTVSIVLGIPILAAWWPLGERPGLGTVLNLAMIGVAINLTLGFVPAATSMGQQVALSAVGILLNAVGTALYLAADLGPGPRDGLMTGLHLRFGWSIRRTRTAIELTVVVVGFLAGGTVGIGTVVFAGVIGPVVQALLRVFDREGRLSARRRASLEARGVLAE